jgi:hypothetical protein
MGKRRVIKIKNPDCVNLNDMQKNYAGLWRTLKMNITRTSHGFLAMTETHSYKLEV